MSAIAALKGYRTQFLYSLHYILSNEEKNYKFQLEGLEDLDVLNETSNLIEVIQVKNLSQTLVQSDLLSVNKTSFLRRVLELEKTHPSVVPTLVSFGPISSELNGWKTSANQISEKEKKNISKFGITPEGWSSLKQRVQFIHVNEDELGNKVLAALKKKFPLIDPIITSECLFYWLSYVAEKQTVISQKDIFLKVESIGNYLTERAAIASTYNLVIKPLNNLQVNEIDIPALKNEFYFGSSARYEHILNNLDVLREDYTAQIRTAFLRTNVVVIQGASGQGKSTLAYRFAHDSAPASLIYELNVQDAPLETATAIKALMSITKNLEVPLLFIINVQPNSTEWLKVVREFSFKFKVQFLITIRHEDWYAAGTQGVDFDHQDIELILGKHEASLIYSSLSAKNEVLGFTSFDEAWVKFGEQGPLLEFIYTITQGESLKSKLNQQIRQIASNSTSSASNQDIELLKIISLADSYGARIDISKTSHFTQIQFVIAKFEKEYLIKVINNGKFIVGLHPVRSNLIVDILYDEYVTNKKEYVYKCLSLINESDIYPFLLQCFYRKAINPIDFLSHIKNKGISGWVSYSAVLKSLLWAGIQNYIEENESALDELKEQMGDSWYIFANIYHKNTLDVEQYQKFINGDIRQLVIDVNKKIQPIETCYKFAQELLNTIAPPSSEPDSPQNWFSFGEVIFWIYSIYDKPIALPTIKDESIKQAFQTLEVDKISKIMLGLYFAGGILNEARIKHSEHFLNRLREKYKVPSIKDEEDSISIDFIADVLKDERSSLHENVIEVIDLLRDAFPDKKKYNAQGHGHRLKLIALPNDETHKTISAENLPPEEWVNLNVITRELYEYKTRPKNWQDFVTQLQEWESNCTKIIHEFNGAIADFYKNKNNYKDLITLANNMGYTSLNQVKHPQSISNPFGLYYGSRRRNSSEVETKQQNHDKLFSRYNTFFKSYRDIKSSITNFINQSGTTIYWKLKEKIGDPSEPYEDAQRLSFINLYSAIEDLPSYKQEKEKHFNKYIQADKGGIKREYLYNTAVLWKQFISAPDKTQKPDSVVNIKTLQNNFETKILKECKSASKSREFNIKYQRSGLTHDRPVFIISVKNYATSLLVTKEIFYIVKNAINLPEYISLKQLLLQSQYSEFYCITLFQGKTINKHWLAFPYYIFRDNDFEDLKLHHWVPKPIEQNIINNLKIESWEDILPELKDATIVTQEFMKLRVFAEHINDLEYFNEGTFDEVGNKIISAHVLEIGDLVNESVQRAFDTLTLLINRFPFDEEKYKNDEFEYEYWNTIFDIRNNILPVEKGDEEYFEAKVDFNASKEWARKLESGSNSAGLLVFFLYDKYINSLAV